MTPLKKRARPPRGGGLGRGGSLTIPVAQRQHEIPAERIEAVDGLVVLIKEIGDPRARGDLIWLRIFPAQGHGHKAINEVDIGGVIESIPVHPTSYTHAPERQISLLKKAQPLVGP